MIKFELNTREIAFLIFNCNSILKNAMSHRDIWLVVEMHKQLRGVPIGTLGESAY
jgi:hypothetical protein